ncbi:MULTISPECIES: sugar ABC transporter ATP-binding protein [unclassified Mesorhizobium]|uniref:sugar ABC transporter ATP-binding protein n=1 Tax=unclassified Mesorhizobium TaxID=325217 RepID=UPI00095D8BFC|nr:MULTISPECIES: sugar ABC transporter ATP-binding protein [unclassified Mesorhizobium]MBN9255711.1 sugar ABC transporter ATP-binding protein [Mesorhizobium sp.]OJX84124.1 MAG: ribose ABC transporter ATP-binding protein [Mesorhizobium sp. 65-26]
MTGEITPVLSVKDVVKTFPAVRALDGVTLDIRRGEVHALLGENGAGKSTLMKILAGMFTPDSGSITLDGREVAPKSPLEAKALGIVLIHQELSLVEELTVAENVFLGALPRRSFGFVDWNALHRQTAEILRRLNCDFAPTSIVGDLSIARKQMVEIARALTVDAKVVIFDEPTASLTDQEKLVLFDIIADLKAAGVGIVYISHRMEEIFRISDRITVLRDGAYRGTLDTAATSEAEVTRLMIGRSLDYSRNTETVAAGAIVLETRGLSCGDLFQDVSFSVRAGEVVGFSGLIGAGRSELAETLFGLRRPTAGAILIDGAEVSVETPTNAIRHGISLVPESRKEQGLVLGMNCRDNITLPQIDALRRGPFLSPAAELDIYDSYQKRLSIRSPGWRQLVRNLSGGNQQKIVIGKWLAMKPRLLIVDEPTRGIDVGSKAEIHNLIRELARGGYAVIVISSEMPEILHVSDRIVTMYHGRVMREFTAAEANEDSLVQAISGLN